MAENRCNCSKCTEVPEQSLVGSHGHYMPSESILDGDIRDALRPDPANPPHYARLSPQPVELINAWGLDYLEGSVVKYLSRWRHKNGVEDLHKAKRFLEMLIEREESR